MKRGISLLVATMLLSMPVSTGEGDTAICDEYQEYIYEISDEYGVCPELIMSIVEAESSGDASISNGGCIGLMGVSEKWNKDRMSELGVTDLNDAYSNILVGTDLLMELAEEYGDLYETLAHYHGETNVDVNNPSSYVLKVANRSMELERIHGK